MAEKKSQKVQMEELVTLLPDSRLADAADVVLDLGGLDEACPLGLAPTTTTTAMM